MAACADCGRSLGRFEAATGACVRCGAQTAGVRCTAGHTHLRVAEADRCDADRRVTERG